MVPRHFALLLCIFILTTASAFAQEDSCSPIDLRSQMGPIQNQHQTSWCYAYAASDLASFKLGKRISPVDMGFQGQRLADEFDEKYRGAEFIADKKFNKKTRNYTKTDGGVEAEVLSYAQIRGFCSADKINDNDLESNKDLDKAILNIYDLTASVSKNPNETTKKDCAKAAQVKKIFPGLQISDLEAATKKGSLNNVGEDIADRACRPRIRPSPPFSVKETETDYDDAAGTFKNFNDQQMKGLNDVLSKKQPLNVSVHMEKFMNLKDYPPGQHANHAMTIVGRRVNPKNGKCEYIVRNSWGPECSRKYKVKCEDGNLFIPADELQNATYRSTYIE